MPASSMTYLKGLLLWEYYTNHNDQVSSIKNKILSSEEVLKKTRNLRKLLDDKIHGYRFYRKPGADKDDFCLEKGDWQIDDYLHDWVYFTTFYLLDPSTTAKRIIRGTYNYIQEHDIVVVDLINELWEEGWIIDIYNYASIRKNLVYEKLIPTLEDIENLYVEISERISNAKTESHNLDEWLYYLYQIIPIATFASLISVSGDEEVKKYDRYFQEVCADILPVFIICLIGVCTENDYIFSEQYLPTWEKDEVSFIRYITSKYVSRVNIPRYWFDLSKFWFNLSKKHDKNKYVKVLLYEKLNKFDQYFLVSMCCHISFIFVKESLDFVHKGTLPMP